MGPGGFRSLQNCCDLASPGLVGSIPTRSRHRRCVTFALALMLAPFGHGAAQQPDTVNVPRVRILPDSLPVVMQQGPPVSAKRAFLYSFMLPGLGQAALDRPTAGALFFTIESIALAMLGKSIHDLREAERFARDSVPLRFAVDTSGRIARNADGTPRFEPAPNRYAGQPSYVASRRTHLEDWIAVLVFNHLISGADAFVAAQLWDLPGQVRLRWFPDRVAVTMTLRR
jgi:hypothetical protein